jgi:hypothetical protein
MIASFSSGFNLHAVGHKGHAGPLIRDAVDGDPAFIAETHAAENATGLSGFSGDPQSADTSGQ